MSVNYIAILPTSSSYAVNATVLFDVNQNTSVGRDFSAAYAVNFSYQILLKNVSTGAIYSLYSASTTLNSNASNKTIYGVLNTANIKIPTGIYSGNYVIYGYATCSADNSPVTSAEHAITVTGGITAPTVSTGSTTGSGTSISLSGSVSGLSVSTALSFVYSTDGVNYTDEIAATPATTSSSATFTALLTGLAENTHYYFKSKVENENGTVYGPPAEFTTGYDVPSVLNIFSLLQTFFKGIKLLNLKSKKVLGTDANGNVIESSLSTSDITNLDTQLSNKVDKVTGKSLISDSEITRLASLSEHYRGKYTSLVALQTAIPVGNSGDNAIVDAGAGQTATEYIWDVESGWVISQGGIITNSDSITEGNTNLYFTENRVRATVATGLTEAETRTNILATDSILTIFGKIKKFFTDLATVAFSGSYTDLSNKPDFIPYTGATTNVDLNDKTITFQKDNLQSTIFSFVNFINNTAATAGVPIQRAGGAYFKGSVFDTTTQTSKTIELWIDLNGITGATTNVNTQLVISSAVDGGAKTTVMTLNGSGSVTFFGQIQTSRVITTTSTDGFIFNESSPAGAGTTVRYSTRGRWISHSYNTSSASDNTHSFTLESRPKSGATTSAQHVISYNNNANGTTYIDLFTFDSDGSFEMRKGKYLYNAASLFADTIGDTREGNQSGVIVKEYCTAASATKGGGTWVVRQKILIDGTHQFGDITNGNYTEIQGDGSLFFYGNAMVFDDEDCPAVDLQQTGSGVSKNIPESRVEFLTTSNLSDYASLSRQISHEWAGSTIFPHLHTRQTTPDTPNWLFQYRWQIRGAAETTAWTNLACQTPLFTYTSGVLNQQVNTVSGISVPVGAGISDILEFRIIRDNANTSGLFAGADAVNATASFKSFDFHIEKNSLGSRTIGAK